MTVDHDPYRLERQRDHLVKILYGSLEEIVCDRLCFAGYPQQLNEAGREAVILLINMIGPKIIELKNAEDYERSRQLVFNDLKRES